MTAFSDLGEVEPHEIWDGVLGRVVQGERATLAVIELAPGSVVPEHRHENEQLGVLVSGAVRFRIGGEERSVEPGGMWRIAAGTPHDVLVGPDGAVVVEAFAPVRGDWDGLPRRAGSTPLWP